jgi:hypothetical protein
MVFVIRNADATIKSWYERGDDLVLLPGETVEVLPISFDEYSKRLCIRFRGRSGEMVCLSRQQMSGNSIIEIICPGEESLDLLVNEKSQRVQLVDGKGSLSLEMDENISSYLIRPANLHKYAAAGQAVLSIRIE